ncbi:MAG: tetratricopeptide repeat protein [Brevinematales bacterium]
MSRSFFHCAMHEMNLHRWKKAEHYLKLSRKKEKHPLASEYLLFVWLCQGKWKDLARTLRFSRPQGETIGLYVWYWYLWYREQWLELEPCLYQMIASENLFVRMFGLFRLSTYHRKPIEEFLSRTGIFEGICTYHEEEKRALLYQQAIENKPVLLSLTGKEKEYEAVLDFLLLGDKATTWQTIRHLSSPIRHHLEKDPRILWELAFLAFANQAYTTAERLLKKLEEMGVVSHVVWYLLGHVYAAQKKWEKAGLWYEKAIHAGLDTPSVWKNLAILTLEKGYLKEAGEYLKQSLRLKRDPEVLYALALLFLRRRQYVQAYELLRRCISYEEVREVALSQIQALKRFLREKSS